MKKMQFYAGIVSLVIAAFFAVSNFTKIEMSFGETFLANVHAYPAAFFALLGLFLIFIGLKPFLRS